MKTEPNAPINPKTEAVFTGKEGLTKREYFAAMAMQGYIAAGSTGMPTNEQIATYAIGTADALIEALNK